MNISNIMYDRRFRRQNERLVQAQECADAMHAIMSRWQRLQQQQQAVSSFSSSSWKMSGREKLAMVQQVLHFEADLVMLYWKWRNMTHGSPSMRV